VRSEFLDDHLLLQVPVTAEVRCADPALPEHALDRIFEQPVSLRERINRLRHGDRYPGTSPSRSAVEPVIRVFDMSLREPRASIDIAEVKERVVEIVFVGAE
jgi:hypothetical protein